MMSPMNVVASFLRWKCNPEKQVFSKIEKMLLNFNASILWNFYFDLSGRVKIQRLAVNVYFGNNVVMVILLKTRIEYPFAHSLSHN